MRLPLSSTCHPTRHDQIRVQQNRKMQAVYGMMAAAAAAAAVHAHAPCETCTWQCGPGGFLQPCLLTLRSDRLKLPDPHGGTDRVDAQTRSGMQNRHAERCQTVCNR